MPRDTTPPSLALHYAWRDIRHGLSGFRLFIICLFLGVTVIATTGLLSHAVNASLQNNARSLLGGDYEFYMSYIGMSDEQRALIDEQSQLSQAIELRSVATVGEQFQLVELKAVDGYYPLYGEVTLSPSMPLEAAFADKGIAVEPELLERFDAAIGDSINLGGEQFTIRAVITSEPDRIVNTFSFGPRALMDGEALRDTSLLQPGSLVRYRYRARLDQGVDGEAWIRSVEQAFPDAAWRVRDFRAAAPDVERILSNLTLFLTLTGLTALLAGGLGISNSVYTLVQRNFFTIATLKSLGASNRFIMHYYMALILCVSLIAIVAALLISALLAWQGAAIITAYTGITTPFMLHPLAVARAVIFGFLIAFTFSLWQLGKIKQIKPAAIFRGRSSLNNWPPLHVVLTVLLLGAALIGFAIVTAENQAVALVYVISTFITILLFGGCSMLLVRAARAYRPQRFWLRHGLANLYRPGARTLPSLISLGIGLTFLVGVSLIDANIQQSIRTLRPDNAPTHFFIDIQPDQRDGFAEILADIGAETVEMAPMLRGNIVSLNGVPVSEAAVAPEVRWAVRGDRGISDASTPPANTRLLSGQWWDADYRGEPLISLDKRLADGMGLEVGDTMTYNILGQAITGTIASLREVHYQDFRMNFSIILSPGVLDAFPRTYIATASLPDDSDILERLARNYPNISPIAVDRAVAQVAALSDNLALAIRVTALFTIFSAIIVLIGALVANEQTRTYDNIVLKVLGARRSDMIKSYAVEYAGIALIAGGISVVAGTAVSYYVIDEFRFFQFSLMPHISIGIAFASLLVITGIGLGITMRAFRHRPYAYLRNE